MAGGRKTAVVTGAAGGIGKAITRRLVEDGYRIVAGDADANGLKALSGEFNKANQSVWELQGDLRSKAYCEALIDFSIESTGRLDLLVNNAGIITRGNILETTDEDWARTFDVNLTAIFYTCRRAIAHISDESTFLLWTRCGQRDVPPGHARELEPSDHITCPVCRQLLH